MRKEIKDILSIYEEFENSRKIVLEVTDIYDSLDFKDNAVGNSTPSRDNINTALLADINTAAKNAGVKVDVTTAISGHHTNGNTRHTSGNAVDIAIINGRPVSIANRADADKLVDQLVKLGYTKNTESSNPKAVLTFGFPEHDDHVHVSNTTGAQSSSNTTSTTPNQSSGNLTIDIGKLNGVPSDIANVTNALNPATALKSALKEQSSRGQEKFYLQFCNVTNPMVRNGQQIGTNTILGKTDEDVEVSKYDSSRSRVNLKKGTLNFGKGIKENLGNIIIPKDSNSKITSPVSGIINNSRSNQSCKNQITIEYYVNEDIKKPDNRRTSEPRFTDPLLGAILTAPLKIFQDKYDKDTGELKQKRFGYAGERVDPWIKDAIVAPFKKIGSLYRKENKEEEERKKKKVDENVEKIKRLLK
jgi:hypothetical protein